MQVITGDLFGASVFAACTVMAIAKMKRAFHFLISFIAFQMCTHITLHFLARHYLATDWKKHNSVAF